jgi:carnitine 3-dehydrogenase
MMAQAGRAGSQSVAGTAVRRAAAIGGGVIGAAWAARFVLNGIDAAIYDPDPELARKLEAVLGNARRALHRLFPGALPAEGRLTIAASVGEAVRGADFIQESLPEREDLKQKIYAEIEAAAGADTIIGSSTSGLLPSRLQSNMRNPARFVVGHPFNPVYLLPLVEICGGERTSAATCEAAASFYRSLGMQPLMLRKEIDGFIADRLMEAVWREALWLIQDGVANTSEIDDAIRYGAGLRWSFMGTFLVYRIAGGEAGMRHFLSQFGPTMKLPWTKLVGPELTDELSETIARQSDEQAQLQAGGKSIRELERLRDDCLVSVLQALARNDFAAGQVVRRTAGQLAARPHAAATVDESRPLELHRATVLPDWIDYNGHMNESRYLQVCSDASDALLAYVGAGPEYVATGGTYYTVETHIRHLGQAHVDEDLRISTQVLAADAKRLHLFHAVHRAAGGETIATGEHMLLHVDAKAGRSAPASGAVLAAALRLAGAHSGLPLPEGVGRAIGQRVGQGTRR